MSEGEKERGERVIDKERERERMRERVNERERERKRERVLWYKLKRNGTLRIIMHLIIQRHRKLIQVCIQLYNTGLFYQNKKTK